MECFLNKITGWKRNWKHLVCSKLFELAFGKFSSIKKKTGLFSQSYLMSRIIIRQSFDLMEFNFTTSFSMAFYIFFFWNKNYLNSFAI